MVDYNLENETMTSKQFFIERTNEDDTYIVISRHDTFDEANEVLQGIDSKLRHSLWCYDWVHTPFGSSPMAWIN